MSGHAARARRRPLYYCLILTLGVGALASVFTTPQIPTWYADLVRPAFALPQELFGPVWTLLYILMAVAAWRAWTKAGLQSAALAAALAAFALQLAANLAWSLVFFVLHRLGAALLVALLLDLAALATTVLFYRADRLAALLYLPCLGWAMYVSLLAAVLGQRNGL